ncbi:MAG TPA: DUF4443 domain-containing protein [Nitrososphaerales archaeon]
MDLVKFLVNISTKRSHGPIRTFTKLQMIRTILILSQKKKMGRTLLSRYLKTGSGAVRTLIKDLETYNIIKIDKSGCSLTERGREIHKQIVEMFILIDKIDAGRLSIDKYNSAVLVKNSANLIGNGIEQRDASIKIGAKGSTTLIYNRDKFTIPNGSLDCAKDYPDNVWINLKKIFNPRDNDVIIVSSSSDQESAIYGALSSALTLIETSKKNE